jgi:CheY-like chemotaxis protein
MKRILVVDDDPDIRESIQFCLDDTFDIEVAANGAEALARVRTSRFDAIVLDLMMPVMNGERFLRELHAERLAVPAIILSAQTGDLARRARAIGAADFLAKPFALPLLEEKLRRLWGEGGEPWSAGPGEGSGGGSGREDAPASWSDDAPGRAAGRGPDAPAGPARDRLACAAGPGRSWVGL